MNPTTIRIIAGVVFVVIIFIIVARRKRMASNRKRVAWETVGISIKLWPEITNQSMK